MKKNQKTIETKDNSGIKIVPVKVQDILNYEVRIGECHVRNDISETIIKNDYLSISKLMKMISEGFFITTSNFNEKLEPSFEQVILMEYWYGNNPDFKQELKDKNIFPTFIIEHDKGGELAEEHTAVLGYCFNKRIDSPQLRADIFNAFGKIFPSDSALIECYNAYDWGDITNLTISNYVYVPVEGDVSYGD